MWSAVNALRVGQAFQPVACLTQLPTAAAERREESRGAHFRSDFPEPRPEWRARQLVTARVSAESIELGIERAPEAPRS